MHTREIRASEHTRVQPAPVDLEHGRLDPALVVQLYVITVCALAIAAGAGLLVQAGAAGAGSTWGWLAAVSTWVMIFGLLLAAVSFGTAVSIAMLAVRGWITHQKRVEAWDAAQLAAYKSAGGQETRRDLTIRTLRLDEPLHLVGVVLAVLAAAEAGEPAPHASTALRGEVWMGGMRLGNLGKSEAEEFSRALAVIGLVKNRRKGYAGELATTDPARALQLVRANYGRLSRERLQAIDREPLERASE